MAKKRYIEVLEVHQFEPTQADSNRYNLTGNPAKVFPVFAEDVRDVLRAVDFVDQGGPRRSSRNAGTSSAEVHSYVPGHTYRLERKGRSVVTIIRSQPITKYTPK